MASKWRMNVLELGWVGSEYRLIARDITWPPWEERFIAAKEEGSTFFDYLLRPAGLPIIPYYFGSDAVVGNFPYGRVVEPD